MASRVPARIQWAADVLGALPARSFLEIGCGPGVLIHELCERRPDATVLLGIDRSAVAVRRAIQRNADAVAAGRVMIAQVALGDLESSGLMQPARRFDAVAAFNVNLFWTGPADREIAVITRTLPPGGSLHLFYGGDAPLPGIDRGDQIADAISRALEGHGFTTTVTHMAPWVLLTGSRAGP